VKPLLQRALDLRRAVAKGACMCAFAPISIKTLSHGPPHLHSHGGGRSFPGERHQRLEPAPVRRADEAQRVPSGESCTTRCGRQRATEGQRVSRGLRQPRAIQATYQPRCGAVRWLAGPGF